MNRTKTIASALLLMILPFASPAFASERGHGDRGRGHEYGQHRQNPYGHNYYQHDRHHGYHHGDYRWHDNHASVTLPFPPLPPFPVIIFKPHH